MQIDSGRLLNPVSGTAIRADVEGYWWALASCLRASPAQRVVVLGAEPMGTTTLATALAEELGTLWVGECGCEYNKIRLGGFTAPWRSDKFDLVVDRQITPEQEAGRRVTRPLLVCDTDVLATALWHERYVREPAERILERAAAHQQALYILTGDEIPFVQDGEHIRHAMQERLRKVLLGQAVPWLEARGSVKIRVQAREAHVRLSHDPF